MSDPHPRRRPRGPCARLAVLTLVGLLTISAATAQPELPGGASAGQQPVPSAAQPVDPAGGPGAVTGRPK